MNTERDPQDVEGVLLDVKLAKARNDALEEAAVAVEQEQDNSPSTLYADAVLRSAAEVIRALKVQP